MSEEYIIIHSFLTLGLFTIIVQMSGLIVLIGLFSRLLKYLMSEEEQKNYD